MHGFIDAMAYHGGITFTLLLPLPGYEVGSNSKSTFRVLLHSMSGSLMTGLNLGNEYYIAILGLQVKYA
jgi:hypothetical protein